HVRRPCPPGDQMADNVGVDALSHHKVRPELDMAKGPAQTTHIGAPLHVSTADRDALASELVEKWALTYQRQDRDVELPAKRGDHESAAVCSLPNFVKAFRRSVSFLIW